ncbi:MAG: PQQ-dependent sugar dehydrogenase [Verrucomicrobiales bacterium]|nr:PQQ-dependent sugar dehydrogenase [Verrucomicrobiales bacterium]
MIHALLSILTKLSLFAFSIFLGMGSYLFVKAKNTVEATKLAALTAESGNSMVYREIAIEAKPALLTRTQSPVDVGGDALGVLYVLQKNGEVVRVAHGATSMSVSTRFASLSTEATDAEIGFSAIAFHPEFLIQELPGYGKFYVVAAEHAGAANPDFIPEFGNRTEHHQDVVYEFTCNHPLAGNFKGQRREVLRFSQPGAENNVRSLTFDHLGNLFLAVGDGAADVVGRHSSSKNASSMTSAYGKVLRIDPLGDNSINGKYGIPSSNPFQLVTEALPELWAFGLRAPHSLSFDPYRSSLCIGETSADGIEKVNLSEFGGEHFGWDLDTGSFLFNMGMRSQLEDIVKSPAFALSRTSGMTGANAGNVVYRGENFPSLAGMLVFASHDGRIMVSDPGAPKSRSTRILSLGDFSRNTFTAMRTAPNGELVVLCEDGSVYEMRKCDSIGAERNRERKLFCMR